MICLKQCLLFPRAIVSAAKRVGDDPIGVGEVVRFARGLHVAHRLDNRLRLFGFGEVAANKTAALGADDRHGVTQLTADDGVVLLHAQQPVGVLESFIAKIVVRGEPRFFQNVFFATRFNFA